MVIEALGQGNIPPSALRGIQQLVSLNIPIVLVSRSFNGIVEFQLTHTMVVVTNSHNKVLFFLTV